MVWMMTIRSRKNQYNGINAHLHSYLQHEPGGWESFHAEHIADLRRVIDSALPQGYYARSERSLQLTELNVWTGDSISRYSKQDVGIYSQQIPQNLTSLENQDSIQTIPLLDTLPDDDDLRSIVISQKEPDGNLRPITRLELLSPANKPPGSHAAQYLRKRRETLQSGINLVEIDYLHERRSPIPVLPDYTVDEPVSSPYLILVSNPYPSIEQGVMQIISLHVDDLLPSLTIPLAEGDAFDLDFDAAYQSTFSQNRYYGEVAVDYAEPPINLDRYSKADQARIEQRMTAIADAFGRGDDLNKAPFPIQDDS